MSGDAIDALHTPERMNKLVARAAARFEEKVRVLMRQAFPDGYMVGQMPERDDHTRLLHLMQQHDWNLSMATNETTLPGDQMRAQAALMEEETLKRKLFGGIPNLR